MKNIYFTVGPSQLYPTVKSHIIEALERDIPSISHRSKLFDSIFEETVSSLRQLLNIPQTYQVFFLGSALESMERIIENCVDVHSFHFVNGAFSAKFYDFVIALKKKPLKNEVSYGQGFDFAKIKIHKNNELICLTHNETSTGVALRMEDIYKLHKKYPEQLIALDIVSSAPYVNIDFNQIDLTFFSVQKGFGLPAGLGVVIVGPRALAKSQQLAKKGLDIGCYHSFPALHKMAAKSQTPETPNVLAIYLLGKVIKDMLKKGINKIRRETDSRAEEIYKYFEQHVEYRPFVKDTKIRSNTTIVVDVKGNSEQIVNDLKTKAIIVGRGYGDYKNEHIRIANFPAHSVKDVQNLLNLM